MHLFPCCVQLGLKKQDMIDVVALGAIASPMFALKGPAMAKASYPPGRAETLSYSL
jgi:3-hydroxyisobutyrate dehydrogenase-like beta-hydroxyacid dehydrogenase